MKVLVLSCNTGGGHNSCGKYIKEEFDLNNIECDFKNYFEIVNLSKKDFSSGIYIKSLGKNGGVFKYVYKIGESYDKTNIVSPVYLFNSMKSYRLYKYIRENNYDLIICSHLFPALSLTAINKKHKINFIFVDTDYEYQPFTDEVHSDYYVIPKGLEERFISKGIDKDKLLPFGIPISSQYIKNAKYLKNTNRKNILIMLGSMGFGNVDKILNDLIKIKKVSITVVCGSNENLYKKLQKYSGKNCKIISFINTINDLIKSSDIVISKPGGLSITEIASFRKAVILAFPIPGVETSNTEYFNKHGLGFVASNNKEIIEYTKILLKNEKVCKAMIANQEKFISINSAKDLVCFINNNY